MANDGFKLGMTIRKNDGTLVTVHADDAGEFIALCEEVSKASEIIEGVARQVAGAGNPPTPALPVTRQHVDTPQVDAWTTSPTAPPPPAHGCAHGPRLRKSGTNARGPWVGWFCQLDRNDPNNCGPIFEH
jgi:hypothetical protein